MTVRWKRGLPPGDYYEGMIDDFDVYFSPIGEKWHRRRSPEERAEYIAQKRRNAQTVGSIRRRSVNGEHR